MNIYLSGPMTGQADYNFPAFEQAAALLRAFGHRVISPHELAERGQPWIDLLKTDLLHMIKYCDAIVMLPGWRTSRGSEIELRLAIDLFFDTYEWVDNMLIELGTDPDRPRY